jgi:hypothetical protein
MDPGRRQCEQRLAGIHAPPERNPRQGTADNPAKDDPDERPRLAVEVNKCKYYETEENQQKPGRKQPDDGRG